MLCQRLYDEREAKLRSVTASISRSHAQNTAPVRHTKLAYVNSVVKPPREVLRRQMKNRIEVMQNRIEVMKNRIEVPQSAAVNGKRTAAAALLTGNTRSPKKKHSTQAAVSSPSHSDPSSQLKGLDLNN